MADDKLYHDQYCKTHDQWYGKHLRCCPICVGEELGKLPVEHIDLTGDKKMEDKGV